MATSTNWPCPVRSRCARTSAIRTPPFRPFRLSSSPQRQPGSRAAVRRGRHGVDRHAARGLNPQPIPHFPRVHRLEGQESLHALLADSNAVAVCCQWTPETTGLIGREAFAAMKPSALLVNIAPGEVVDEEALIAALAAGTLRGVALDVYVEEFEREPDREPPSDAPPT